MVNTSGSMNIFTIMSLSIIASCAILSCCGYLLAQRKNKKRQQIQFMNETYAPEVQEQVFTIDIPYTQPSDGEQSIPYLSDTCPPSYETVESTAPAETPSITTGDDQMETK